MREVRLQMMSKTCIILPLLQNSWSFHTPLASSEFKTAPFILRSWFFSPCFPGHKTCFLQTLQWCEPFFSTWFLWFMCEKSLKIWAAVPQIQSVFFPPALNLPPAHTECILLAFLLCIPWFHRITESRLETTCEIKVCFLLFSFFFSISTHYYKQGK